MDRYARCAGYVTMIGRPESKMQNSVSSPGSVFVTVLANKWAARSHLRYDSFETSFDGLSFGRERSRTCDVKMVPVNLGEEGMSPIVNKRSRRGVRDCLRCSEERDCLSRLREKYLLLAAFCGRQGTPQRSTRRDKLESRMPNKIQLVFLVFTFLNFWKFLKHFQGI